MPTDTLFLSRPMTIEPAWIDWNGHLNMAYYNVLFDRSGDEFVAAAGLGPDYAATRRLSTMTAEVHVRYLREIFLDTRPVVRWRILGLDAKRLHSFAELLHPDEGWVSATSEQMTLHVDLDARRVTPWPADVLAGLERLWAPSRDLAPPEGAGRAVAMARPASPRAPT